MIKKIIVCLSIMGILTAPSLSYAGSVDMMSNSKKISYGLMAAGVVVFLIATNTGGGSNNFAKAKDPYQAIAGLGSDTLNDMPNMIGATVGVVMAGSGGVVFLSDIISEISSDDEVAQVVSGEHRSLVRYAKSDLDLVDPSLAKVEAGFVCGSQCESEEQRTALVKQAILAIDAEAKSMDFTPGVSELNEQEFSERVMSALPDQLKNIKNINMGKLVMAVALINNNR